MNKIWLAIVLIAVTIIFMGLIGIVSLPGSSSEEQPSIQKAHWIDLNAGQGWVKLDPAFDNWTYLYVQSYKFVIHLSESRGEWVFENERCEMVIKPSLIIQATGCPSGVPIDWDGARVRVSQSNG